ncbi:hypothetical protein BS47DRAFT_1337713 [Hydnum rufescens UP504]|uniref:Uncharacterized protein n=1 Tax=Hydnum rufescens UP504 TaxID=1448309 RepID=A0A9P6E142_9AGAM|nr:hypothetical protein BS47DRAFT_1337713 [Hydnum rufescens UP504]
MICRVRNLLAERPPVSERECSKEFDECLRNEVEWLAHDDRRTTAEPYPHRGILGMRRGELATTFIAYWLARQRRPHGLLTSVQTLD